MKEHAQQKSNTPESRAHAVGALERFLRHTGLKQPDETKRIAWIKVVEPKKLFDILSIANGLIRDEEKFQRWEGVKSKNAISVGGNKDSLDVEPPEHAEQEFLTLIQKIQHDIEKINLPLQAARLFMGIIFSHMFPDGNGRTARTVYTLLRNGRMPGKNSFVQRNNKIQELSAAVNAQAIAYCFQKEGVVEDGTYDEYYLTIGEVSLGGMVDHLKYLAARRILQKTQETIPKTIELTDMTTEQKDDFEHEYARIRKEFFWMTQEVVDQHSTAVLRMFDEGFPEFKKENA